MATDLKTWTKELYNVTGSVLAGPAGALIGSLTGGLVSALLAAAAEQSGEFFAHPLPNTADYSVKALFEPPPALEPEGPAIDRRRPVSVRRRSFFRRRPFARNHSVVERQRTLSERQPPLERPRPVLERPRSPLERLDPIEKRHINHDLQTTLREALREAIYDLGGERCFPQVWGERPRQVPENLIFLATSQGEGLWQAQDPLAQQVCRFFIEMLNAVAEQRLLPLEPPLDRPAARVYPVYPEAEMPQALTEAFFYQVILLPLHSFDKLLSALPEFEASLRRNLIDRTLVHLGGLLKARQPAWSAYNRLVLEALSGQVRRIDAAQTGILSLLDGLLPIETEESQLPASSRDALAQWSNGLADLLSGMGRLVKQAEESFTAVLARLEQQGAETPARLHLLLAGRGQGEEVHRPEGSAQPPGGETPAASTQANGRRLRFLEDGSYTIEGPPPVALDEPPLPGFPPYRGLKSYSSADAELFFGRERLIARLVDRLRPAPATRKGSPGGGSFLALIGASGCGKTSLVCAGLIPALQRGQPLANGTLLPPGSESWPVHRITPGEHPLLALAESLARQDRAITPETLTELMRMEAHSLHHHVLKMLNPEPREVGRVKKSSRNPQARVLLIVDQFEELFALCADPAERKAFVDNLLAAVEGSPPVLVLVIVLRADFYARCAEYENLRQAIASRQEYIGALSSPELRRAIEEPARRGDWELEAGLVKIILADLGDGETPGNLPALSHTLLETWKARRGRVMALESYAESGGVTRSIARSAERVCQQLESSQQAIARTIFVQLAGLSSSGGSVPAGDGTPLVCRPLRRTELATSPEAADATEAVLQSLAEAGLVTLSQESVAITHEALLPAWPALRAWLDEETAGLTIHRRLAADALAWRRSNNVPTAIYRGVRLAQAQEWATGHADLLSPLEAEFLEFSKFVLEHEAAARVARSDAQRQSVAEIARPPAREGETAGIRQVTDTERRQVVAQAARRQHIHSLISAGMTALLILATILALAFAIVSRQQQTRADHRAATARQSQAEAQAGRAQAEAAQSTAQAQAQGRATAEAYALSQQGTAEAARGAAQRQALIAMARELAAFAHSFTSQDTDLALLLAAEAVNVANNAARTPVDTAQNALFNALQVANYSAVLRGHTGEVLSAVYSPDGKYALTASKDGAARLWELSSRESTLIRAYTGGITAVAFSPDGKRILTTGSDQGQDGLAEVWELGGAQAAVLAGHTGDVLAGSFDPDGTLIATGGQDNSARVWQSDGTLLAVLVGHTGAVTAVRFSPDGARLLTLSADATARLWQIDGTPVATLSGHNGPVLEASFNADSSRILTASADGTARIWLADGTPAGTLAGHTGAVYSAVFSSDAQRLLTAGADGTARLWRADGTPLYVLAGPSSAGGSPGASYTASFAPGDPGIILTVGLDAAARLWRADGALLATLNGHTARLYSARFSADGRQIITASADRTARLWDIDRLYASPVAQNEFAVAWAGFSPDGQQVLTAGADGVARLFSLAGVEQAAFSGHATALTGASFSPDGQLVATASMDGFARLWRPGGTFLVELHGHTGPVRSVSFSPDSKLLVTASEDGSARLYHISGAFEASLEGHTGAVRSAFFSPDGSQIITAGQDGTARLWRVADGALLETIDHNQAPLNMATFSPDGKMVITAGQDGYARLWLADGTPVASLAGHTGAVNWAAFSPDGSLIATASLDGSLRLWTIDGNFLAAAQGHTQGVVCAGFSPDGRLLATASQDGTVRLWSIYASLEAMRGEAMQRAGRTLTAAECQQFRHTETCPAVP